MSYNVESNSSSRSLGKEKKSTIRNMKETHRVSEERDEPSLHEGLYNPKTGIIIHPVILFLRSDRKASLCLLNSQVVYQGYLPG